MRHTLYNVLLLLTTPVIVLYLALRPKYHPLLNRFYPHLPTLNTKPIWVQAASVGEVITAKPFILALKKAYPEIPILLTSGTATGMQEALSYSDEFHVAWFPLDHPWVVRSFFKRLSPRCLVLIETELWPNVLHRAHQSQTPVVIVNGRLSEKHFSKYLKHREFIRSYLTPITLAMMQSPLDAERIETLGVLKDSIKVTGNIKFDGAALEADPEGVATLRAELGLTPDSQILVFGSTRPGEEAMFIEPWRQLKSIFPQLCLIIAPRHLKRLSEATEAFTGEVIHTRSALAQSGQKVAPGEVILLDTLGELKSVYALATIALVGGSFSPDVQGHNPIEPAALGIPTVFGPHMKNFLHPASILTQCEGVIQVNDPATLVPTLQALLQDESARVRMGARAQAAVRENQGAIERSLEMMRDLLN